MDADLTFLCLFLKGLLLELDGNILLHTSTLGATISLDYQLAYSWDSNLVSEQR